MTLRRTLHVVATEDFFDGATLGIAGDGRLSYSLTAHRGLTIQFHQDVAIDLGFNERLITRSATCAFLKTAQCAAVGVVSNAAAFHDDMGGVECRLLCCICPAVGRGVPVVGVRVCQCTAAIEVVADGATCHFDGDILLDNTQLAATIDGAMHGAAIDIERDITAHTSGNVKGLKALSTAVDVTIRSCCTNRAIIHSYRDVMLHKGILATAIHVTLDGGISADGHIGLCCQCQGLKEGLVSVLILEILPNELPRFIIFPSRSPITFREGRSVRIKCHTSGP